jgi:hypothetical protein
MQSHTTMPLTLEQGIKAHPNVDYRPKPAITPMIAPETFRMISVEKVYQYLDKLLDKRNRITKFFPNIFTVRTSVSAIMEREAYDHRISMFKKREPQNYNTLLAKIDKQLGELEQHRSIERQKAVALTESLAEFKEATNLSFESHMRRY